MRESPLKIWFARPDIRQEDEKHVVQSMQNQTLTNGQYCKRFESTFTEKLGIIYSKGIAVNSCMAALQMSYLVMGIGTNDEVIVPAMTHVATAHAVELTGATPIFVDCQPNGNIHHDIERHITRKTKAISLVHYNGIPCRTDYIIQLAKNYGLFIVEDCAIALGARYNNNSHVGSFSFDETGVVTFGCFSFYPSKHITTTEGGMFLTNHSYLYNTAKMVASFGKNLSTQGYQYDMVLKGSNFRMGEMQSALGYSQISRIEEVLEKRKKNFNTYSTLLNLEKCRDGMSPYFFRVDYKTNNERDEAIKILMKENIGHSVYYPKPVPEFIYYKRKYGFQPIRYSNAIRIAYNTIALPIGQHLTDQNISRICSIIKTTNYIKEN
jgi:dTDP-4-amino-4,6-dideoxygalactose transaminase